MILDRKLVHMKTFIEKNIIFLNINLTYLLLLIIMIDYDLSFNYSDIICIQYTTILTYCTLIKRQSYWLKNSLGSSIASYNIYFILSTKNILQFFVKIL